MYKIRLVVIFLLCMVPMLLAQDNLKAGESDAGTIRAMALVAHSSIPLNRTVLFTIRLEWYGDLDRFEIQSFDNPPVQNFEIIGTASANKVASESGRAMAIREYQYTLKPLELGMGYVDGVIVTYEDAATEKQYRLITNRLEIKVVDPLPEPGSNNWIYMVFALMLVSGLTAYFILYYKRKKAERIRREQELAASAIPLETNFLQELEEAIELDDPDLSVANAFAVLSRMVRRYLAEKHGVAALELTTERLINELNLQELDERYTTDMQEILTTADIYKFSGSTGDKSALDRSFTLFENNLQKMMHEVKQQ